MSCVIESNNKYDKMDAYANTLYQVFKIFNNKGKETKNQKMGYISMIIYNYFLKIANDNNINISEIERDNMDIDNISNKTDINLIPLFEYISYNNIELFDFEKINMEDIDIKNNKSIERFVLTHIYYITQK